MEDKNCVTFVWKICNLEVGVRTNGDMFFSPSYHVSSLRGSAWVFWLHTSSFDNLSKEIQIVLENQYYDRPNSNEFLIHFELSILAVNPSLTCTYTYQNIKIRAGSEHKITGLPAWETLLQNRNEYLPEDVMTIQCRLWKVNTRYKDLEPLFYKGLTHTGYQKCSLTWSINFSDFEKCGTTRCKKFDLGESEPVFNLSTCSDFKREALGFNIQQLSGDFPFLHLFFKISVLDASSGNVILSKQSSCQLKPLEVLKLDPFIAFSFLKFNRKHIMKGNTLDLACEFVYNNEDDHVFMESVSNIPPMCIKKPAGSIQIEKVIEPPKKIAPTSKGLKEDLYDLYLSNSCCDVVLVAGICTFPCHKCVLFARSPVFRSILSESTTNYKIELDSSTLASFLQFLYNDDIGKPMDFLSALNLYEAAEKFQVLSLKSVCTKYLESNLTKQNACDILILSSKHQDSKLKEFVENFILKYPLDIFRTERWKNLMKSDAKHVVETMCKVYLKKGKLNLRTTAFDDYYENNFYGSLENLKFRLLELLKTSEYSDLKLHVKGRSFAVHKNILWARSPLFERLIESNSECSSNLETLISNLFSGVEIRTVEQILNFIYYGELMDEYYSEVSYEEEQSLAYKQLIEIYCTACRCQILSLRKSCSKTLARELNRDNVSEILQLAELHGDEKLKEDIYNFIFRCKHVTSWDTWKSFEKKNADLAKRTMVKVSLIRHW